VKSNALERFIVENLGPQESIMVNCLNDLQNNGIISDLCVTVADVAEVDCPAAIAFLNQP